MSIRHFLGRVVLASALTIAVTPAFAGKLFISGQDSDDSGHGYSSADTSGGAE